MAAIGRLSSYLKYYPVRFRVSEDLPRLVTKVCREASRVLLLLHTIEQPGEARRNLCVSPEPQRIVCRGELPDSSPQLRGGQRCRELGWCEPWRLLIPAPLEN